MRGTSIEDLASFSIEASRALKVVCTKDRTLKEAMLIRSLIDGLLPLQFRAYMRILMESKEYSTLKAIEHPQIQSRILLLNIIFPILSMP